MIWHTREGEPIACREKLRVLEENEQELLAVMQDAFEDAVLMGVDEFSARERIAGLAAQLKSPRR
jgi:PHD/YefM family antitoxin component YafN of YafNO toxin-antitoxin module